MKHNSTNPGRASACAFRKSILSAAMLAAAVPGHAAWDTYLKGAFGPAVDWPLIPIHVVLLPDGRVMSYGTDAKGQQTGQFIYDVWTPAKGTDAASHLTLPNTTSTDIFCSGQIVLPGSGTVIFTGGDKTINNVRNFSVKDVTLFDYNSNTLYSAPQQLNYLRWYPSVLTTAAGEILVLGGRADPATPVPTPEVYQPSTGTWRPLNNAVSGDAYGSANVFYPRAWQAPNGKVFIATKWGGTYYLDPAGAGKLDRTGLTLPAGDEYLTSVMYEPGRILALRKANKAVTINLNGTGTPTAANVTGVGQDRFHGSATVMADGRVLVSGGSAVANQDNGTAYTAKIWNPANASWTTAATATKMRLYHSVSMLLPDGRVLTAGGGAPGPVANLNAEIYTPPYLYKQMDFAATLAPRPSILSAPASATWGQAISVGTDITSVKQVTLVKTGSATHTVDFDQRFIKPAYTLSGSTVKVSMPASSNVAPPGYYMLFVFNSAGVPSIAKIIKLGAGDPNT